MKFCQVCTKSFTFGKSRTIVLTSINHKITNNRIESFTF